MCDNVNCSKCTVYIFDRIFVFNHKREKNMGSCCCRSSAILTESNLATVTMNLNNNNNNSSSASERRRRSSIISTITLTDNEFQVLNQNFIDFSARGGVLAHLCLSNLCNPLFYQITKEERDYYINRRQSDEYILEKRMQRLIRYHARGAVDECGCLICEVMIEHKMRKLSTTPIGDSSSHFGDINSFKRLTDLSSTDEQKLLGKAINMSLLQT